VLDEMLSDHKITAAEAAAAKAAPLGLNLEAPANTEAPYFVEEVRRQLEREYGTDEVHGAGLRVYTTLDLDLQHAAEKAVLDGRQPMSAAWMEGRPAECAGEGADLATYGIRTGRSRSWMGRTFMRW
jgi:penicillin-binding protein 1A